MVIRLYADLQTVFRHTRSNLETNRAFGAGAHAGGDRGPGSPICGALHISRRFYDILAERPHEAHALHREDLVVLVGTRSL